MEADILKIILSRKGFDSSAGGHPSPILPDGSMFSLPIPSSLDNLDYNDIAAPGGRTCGQIIEELAAGARIREKGAHLDPDLVYGARPRRCGWRPALGQIGAAGKHLQNEGVSVGGLFLFFGWFRHSDEVDGRLRFSRGSSGFHAIFGYMEVGQIHRAPNYVELPEWLCDHPHATSRRMGKSTNTIYVATPKLSFHQNYPGAGAFQFDDSKILTKKGQSRSRWNLDPALFRHVKISYHSDKAWEDGYFQSYPRAQEYVIHADSCIVAWAQKLILSSQLWEMS